MRGHDLQRGRVTIGNMRLITILAEGVSTPSTPSWKSKDVAYAIVGRLKSDHTLWDNPGALAAKILEVMRWDEHQLVEGLVNQMATHSAEYLAEIANSLSPDGKDGFTITEE